MRLLAILAFGPFLSAVAPGCSTCCGSHADCLLSWPEGSGGPGRDCCGAPYPGSGYPGQCQDPYADHRWNMCAVEKCESHTDCVGFNSRDTCCDIGDGSGLTCNSDSKCREATDEIEGRVTSSKQATVYPSPWNTLVYTSYPSPRRATSYPSPKLKTAYPTPGNIRTSYPSPHPTNEPTLSRTQEPSPVSASLSSSSLSNGGEGKASGWSAEDLSTLQDLIKSMDEALAQVPEKPQGPRKNGKKSRTKKKGNKTKKNKKRKGQLRG